MLKYKIPRSYFKRISKCFSSDFCNASPALSKRFPRTIFKKAYVNNLISDDKVWINLLEDRNSTSHIYNESMAEEIADRIKNQYVAAISELIDNLEKLL